jgi:hypothetical protein
MTSTTDRATAQASIRAKTLQLAQVADKTIDPNSTAKVHLGATEADAINGIIQRDLGAADQQASVVHWDDFEPQLGNTDATAMQVTTALKLANGAEAAALEALNNGDLWNTRRHARTAITIKSRAAAMIPRKADGSPA